MFQYSTHAIPAPSREVAGLGLPTADSGTPTWTPIDPVPVSRFRGILVLKRGPTERPKDTSWNDTKRSSKEHLK